MNQGQRFIRAGEYDPSIHEMPLGWNEKTGDVLWGESNTQDMNPNTPLIVRMKRLSTTAPIPAQLVNGLDVKPGDEVLVYDRVFTVGKVEDATNERDGIRNRLISKDERHLGSFRESDLVAVVQKTDATKDTYQPVTQKQDIEKTFVEGVLDEIIAAANHESELRDSEDCES